MAVQGAQYPLGFPADSTGDTDGKFGLLTDCAGSESVGIGRRGDRACPPTVPATSKALTGSNWLLAYKGGRRRWLANETEAFIQEDPCFEALLDAGVGFYNAEAGLPALFQQKQDAPADIDFDPDKELDNAFDVDDIDEEYFDSLTQDDDEDDGEPGSAQQIGASLGALALDPEVPDDW